jgi:hypothetical protein
MEGFMGTDSLDRFSYECIQFPTRQRQISGYRIGHFGTASSLGRTMGVPHPTVFHEATSMLASATGIFDRQ